MLHLSPGQSKPSDKVRNSPGAWSTRRWPAHSWRSGQKISRTGKWTTFTESETPNMIWNCILKQKSWSFLLKFFIPFFNGRCIEVSSRQVFRRAKQKGTFNILNLKEEIHILNQTTVLKGCLKSIIWKPVAKTTISPFWTNYLKVYFYNVCQLKFKYM